MAQGVLVFAETSQGGLAAIAKEMLGAGRRLADALGGPLMAAVLGIGWQVVDQEAMCHRADTGYVADAPALAYDRPLPDSTIMAQIAEQATPNIVLIGMGDIGRERGPRLAFRLRTGLASDCVELTINPQAKLLEA